MDPAIIQAAFISPPTSNQRGNGTTTGASTSRWNGPPIPSTVNVCVPVNSRSPHSYDYDNMQQQQNNNHQQLSPSSSPIIAFVFRRTRQRKSLHNMITVLPSFRLDDECDFASSLVKRLAPTADMEIPPPDTWEELVHDGTDWLLGSGSMLPPKHAAVVSAANGVNNNNNQGHDHDHHISSTIPLDDFERERAKKIANLRSKMAAEAMQVDRTEDVEAATIRGMIQKAVGLAFVRASKVVLGVSIHGGSGIVIARLSDGTWSAPSAIGTWGLGLGLQFGLEVAEYIFILQTQESLDHFRTGGSFTIGGNIGAAVAGMGREAYGAASAGGTCGGSGKNNEGDNNENKDNECNDNDSNDQNFPSGAVGMMNYINCASQRNKNRQQPNNNNFGSGSNNNNAGNGIGIAPIVAYAKSQGLYIGVSLEGSRIFARDDINSRTYKFTCGRDVSAYDILSGKVPTPPEAEDLYAALHSVEFTHEMSILPRPPEILRRDSPNAWYYNRSTLGDDRDEDENSSNIYNYNRRHHGDDPFNFLSTLNQRDGELCESFETHFKKFMYGGVSVQRLLPNTESRQGRTGRERRTLWLMLPEVGSLRLGFVSKLSDGESSVAVSNKSSTLRARRDDPSITGVNDANSVNDNINNNNSNRNMRYHGSSNNNGDLMTVESEEVTLDSALYTDRDGASTLAGTSALGAGTGGQGQYRRSNQNMYNNNDTTNHAGNGAAGNVQLSNKHSVALTDVTILSQDPLVPIRFNPEDQTEHLRVISMQDAQGTSLLFLANNFREAELLVCGLKLLLERETVRLGVRGGMPIEALGYGTTGIDHGGGDEIMKPVTNEETRGFANNDIDNIDKHNYHNNYYNNNQNNYNNPQLHSNNFSPDPSPPAYTNNAIDGGDAGAASIPKNNYYHRSYNKINGSSNNDHRYESIGRDSTTGGVENVNSKHRSNRSVNSVGYSSSEADDGGTFTTEDDSSGSNLVHKKLPEGRKNWGHVPGRNYMRVQAAAAIAATSHANPTHNENTNYDTTNAYFNSNHSYTRSDNSTQSGNGSHNSGSQFIDRGISPPQYVHNQLLVRDITKNVVLPLPLPLCRVMILDSTSPVVKKWESDRGDTNFHHTPWTFPPATPRELERHSSEHQLIATGSMCGAHRTIVFNRTRNGSHVRLSETQIVDADDSEKLAMTIAERMPRRGFSIKVRILLRAVNTGKSCEATVFAEVRPVGKDLSNQPVVHKAFQLVLNEIKARYGQSDNGLMAGFLHVIANMCGDQVGGTGNGGGGDPNSKNNHRLFPRTVPSPSAMVIEEKKVDGSDNNQSNYRNVRNSPRKKGSNVNISERSSSSRSHTGLVSFEDVLKTGRQSPEVFPSAPIDRPSTPSLQQQIPEPDPAKRFSAKSKNRHIPDTNTFAPIPVKTSSSNDGSNKNNSFNGIGDYPESKDGGNDVTDDAIKNMKNNKKKEEPLLIEVKPLPKIRLSLMPSPREEDEESECSFSPASASNPNEDGTKNDNNKKNEQPTSKRRTNSSWRKASRHKK